MGTALLFLSRYFLSYVEEGKKPVMNLQLTFSKCCWWTVKGLQLDAGPLWFTSWPKQRQIVAKIGSTDAGNSTLSYLFIYFFKNPTVKSGIYLLNLIHYGQLRWLEKP